jgi:hypothetical protein
MVLYSMRIKYTAPYFIWTNPVYNNRKPWIVSNSCQCVNNIFLAKIVSFPPTRRLSHTLPIYVTQCITRTHSQINWLNDGKRLERSDAFRNPFQPSNYIRLTQEIESIILMINPFELSPSVNSFSECMSYIYVLLFSPSLSAPIAW